MGSRWLEGVVAGCHDGTHKVFFVQTWDGIAVVYPRIHNRDPSVRVGAYVRVRVSPAPKMTLNMEVEELSVIDRPVDHEVNVMGEEIEVICNVSLLRELFGWFIFKNDFLGRLSMRNDGGNLEKNLRIGCKYRVICGRARNGDGSPMLQEKTFWTISDIRLAEQTDTVSWYEGVVTRTSDFISITSFELSIDVVLRARFCSRNEREDLLGRWVKFQLEAGNSQRGLMYVAKWNYKEIKPRMKTRVKEGLVELRVICRFDGEMEEGRPLLQSKIGPIRDQQGIIDERNGEGEYDFWVVKHYSPRWKLSIYDNQPPVKIDKMELREGGSYEEKARQKRDRRVLEMMQEFMKISWIREKLSEDAPDSYKKIVQVLDRDRP